MTVKHRVTAIYRAVIYRFDCICDFVRNTAWAVEKYVTYTAISFISILSHIVHNPMGFVAGHV